MDISDCDAVFGPNPNTTYEDQAIERIDHNRKILDGELFVDRSLKALGIKRRQSFRHGVYIVHTGADYLIQPTNCFLLARLRTWRRSTGASSLVIILNTRNSQYCTIY